MHELPNFFQQMTYLGHSDQDLPSIPKPSLQQYDNYQIYDMVCVDVAYEMRRQSDNSVIDNNLVMPKSSWMAIQAFSPYDRECDFIEIANTYK